ncbi:MAG: glycosyltransferase involved in cell wall biosynthesis [Paraglaciecola sp.]|jgi:glycosyltransferase involved in cell wall biosynthesis
MKVLFLQNVLFDYRIAFYNCLVKRGYQLTVLHSGAASTLQCDFEELVVPVRKFGPIHLQQQRPDLDEYDVVIAMFDLYWPANALLSLVSRQYRLIFWGHGLGKGKLGNYLRIALANKANAMVVYTDIGRQAMLKKGMRAELTYVANNTVEVSNHQIKTGQGDSFLYVGRLQSRKRLDLLMHAFAKLMTAVPDKTINLAIVGDGDIREELENLAKTLKIDKCTQFYGAVSDNEMLKPIFHRAIAYVSPGHLGLGLNHALAFGVPIISNGSVTHAPEVAVLNVGNSMMITATEDSDCIEQLTQKMTTLVTDESLAVDMSLQSYADYVNYCSMDRMVDGFVAAIESHTTH